MYINTYEVYISTSTQAKKRTRNTAVIITEKKDGVSSCSEAGSRFQRRQDCSSLDSSVFFQSIVENAA